jgi:hypothetical protein
MSTVNLSGKEKTKVYETIFSSPGLKDVCKANLQLKRLTILLLCRLIERGLSPDGIKEDALLQLLPKESQEELQNLMSDLLRKGELTDFYENLKML